MHQWKFFRSGGFDQVLIETDSDYRNLEHLDQKLWSVLACPVSELTIEPTFLSLVDTDGDGIIRVPEVIQIVNRMNAVLQNAALIAKSPTELEIGQLRTDTEAGLAVKDAFRFILDFTENPGPIVSNELIKAAEEKLSALPVSGNKSVYPERLPDGELKEWLKILVTFSGSGSDTISEEQILVLHEEAKSFLQWKKESGNDPATRIFGATTENALQIFQSVESKIDDYFNRVELLEFNQDWAPVLNAGELPELKNNVAVWPESLENMPLSEIRDSKNFHLSKGLNPAWKQRIHDFQSLVLKEISGSSKELTTDDWLKVKSVFSPLIRWKQSKPTLRFDDVEPARLTAVAEARYLEDLAPYWKEDSELSDRFDKCRLASETLVILKNLQNLLVNFVSLRQFYTRMGMAAFQAGVLYLDNRCGELVIRVKDVNSHATMANLSYTYLVYCECTRHDSPAKLLIAAAYTDGDVDYLMAGRNGLYYDRDGKDWNAKIVKILEHPISIRQAFFSPYNRFARMISSQLEKMAASRDKAVESNAGAAFSKTAETNLSQQAPPPSPQPFDVGKFAGIFAAIGLAVGFISSAVVSVITGFLGLSWYQMPLVILGLMLLISGPSMVLAWLKLRQRTLAPVLDANGWAVNTRAKINIPFGRSLTRLAKLPAGAQRLMKDPYQEKNKTLPIIVGISLLLGGLAWCWWMGWISW